MAEYNVPVYHEDPIEIEIKQLFDRIIVEVNQRREAVLTMYRDLKQDIATRPLERVKQEGELVQLKTETENRIRMNQNRQFQQDFLTKINLQLADIRIPQPVKRVVFKSQYIPLGQLIAKLGEVLEEVDVSTATVPNYQTMEPFVTVGQLGKAPRELYEPHAVAIDSNDCIFVAEGSLFESHARISVFSKRGEYLDAFSHQDMSRPYGIAIHGNNLFITDIGVHSIFHFKIATGFPLIAKRGTNGQQIGKFNMPRNLAVSDNGDVFVADCDNHRVQIFNISLSHLRNLTQQLILHPRDIKLPADEVYVLCRGNPCIHVFSHAGERIRSLVSRGDQMQATYPHFFCLDSVKNLIMSDHETHKILIFTKEGNFIRTIGAEGHQAGMLSYPEGLALTKDLSLVVVSDNINFGLQIYFSI